ncbi:MAG TPA: acyl-CoA dehydrogenase family protein [Kouleothrix sp.]|nr:acyl-CoA dehydrogenase family protein [Kouleothrix sp.]
MKRTLFEAEHLMFRDAFRTFLAREVASHYPTWEHHGCVPRELWRAAGRAGFLGPDVPEQYGGAGLNDYRYNAVLVEELARGGFMGIGMPVHNDIVIPYILRYASPAAQARWLPGLTDGMLVGAIAMTEPGTGSDLAGIRTSAVRDGDAYVINGQKTFISNGILSDIVIVVARTEAGRGHRGISLLVVERDMPGFRRGRNLEKIGLHAQDTAELFFDNVRVPAENLLGEAGAGFAYLMQQLPQERLTIAVSAIAAAEAALEWTVDYCKSRSAFGQPLANFQNTRFVLAELKTELTIGRSFIDQCITAHNAGQLSADEAAMAKWWSTELQQRTADRCLQLHGGYGYMREYAIARMYLDTRVQTIYGGTTEIMKEIIGRAMFEE